VSEEGLPGLSLEKFLVELGAKTPSPGGGAVAALAGASGAALLLMAAEYSDWPAGTVDPRARLRELSAELLRLAQADAEAYAAYSAARTRRKEDPEAWTKALGGIARAPLTACERAVEALGKVPAVLARAPKWFACDVAIASSSLETCAAGTRLLAGINVAGFSGAGREELVARLNAVDAALERALCMNSPLLLRALPGK
jgi:formiminotetrahydrofolate cyclodeaminase